VVADSGLSYQAFLGDLDHANGLEAVWCCAGWCSWETSRGRYDEHINEFSLRKKSRFYPPIGERNHFWRLLMADFGRAHYRCQQQRGTCRQHNQTIFPQLTARLSISLVLLKKRINRIVCKEMFVCNEIKENNAWSK
jgi:hypothetical protein